MDLARFVTAQRDVYETALAELRAGRKASHWIWFVFPQLTGLGRSATARFYGLASLAEARLYLRDPLLGPRLRACTAAVLDHRGTDPEAIFGATDALKFRSSMTLFAAAADEQTVFADALDAFYGGMPDPATLALLEGAAA